MASHVLSLLVDVSISHDFDCTHISDASESELLILHVVSETRIRALLLRRRGFGVSNLSVKLSVCLDEHTGHNINAPFITRSIFRIAKCFLTNLISLFAHRWFRYS